MIFDANLMFWGSAPFASVSNFTSLATFTATTGSAVINMGVAQDLGIGDGVAVPKIAAYIGTAITCASASLNLNFQFQGSTDSSNWTTYAETGALATSSFTAGAYVLPIDVPKRPSGISLPQYYRLAIAFTGNGTATISAGSILAGIVLQRSDNSDTLGLYSSGFTVAA